MGLGAPRRAPAWSLDLLDQAPHRATEAQASSPLPRHRSRACQALLGIHWVALAQVQWDPCLTTLLQGLPLEVVQSGDVWVLNPTDLRFPARCPVPLSLCGAQSSTHHLCLPGDVPEEGQPGSGSHPVSLTGASEGTRSSPP